MYPLEAEAEIWGIYFLPFCSRNKFYFYDSGNKKIFPIHFFDSLKYLSDTEVQG